MHVASQHALASRCCRQAYYQYCQWHWHWLTPDPPATDALLCLSQVWP